MALSAVTPRKETTWRSRHGHPADEDHSPAPVHPPATRVAAAASTPRPGGARGHACAAGLDPPAGPAYPPESIAPRGPAPPGTARPLGRRAHALGQCDLVAVGLP